MSATVVATDVAVPFGGQRVLVDIVDIGDGAPVAQFKFALSDALPAPAALALASAFTDATGTLTATHLSFELNAGQVYNIDGYLIISNTLAADGFQCNFNGGNATATALDITLDAMSGSDVTGTLTTTALNTKLSYTTITGTNKICVHGYIKCNAAGTFILQAATNTTVSGTMTLAAGSWLSVSPIATA